MNDDEVVPDREHLEAQLETLAGLREGLSILRSNDEKLSALMKVWLQKNPDEKLRDGEHGITASLQERDMPGPRPCDLWALYENNKPLFEQLLKTNSLQIHEAGLKAAGALVGGIDRYLGPKGRTVALLVKRDD